MKKRFTTLLAILTIGIAAAAPISEQQARRIAVDFFTGGTRSGAASVSLEWSGRTLQSGIIQRSAHTNANDALLYIYNRDDSNGFVIVSGDDNSRPIIGYSDSGVFDVENMAPATREFLSAWCQQIEATTTKPSQKYSTSAGSIVCSFQTALWDQDTPYNAEAPYAFGYQSLTGCVATAMSIIAYYHRWPEQGVGTTPAYEYEYGGTTLKVDANKLGRKYDYNNMLSEYKNGYTAAQGAAVAALMKDMGTSVQMQYTPYWSGAFSHLVPRAMSTYFGYSKSALCTNRGTKSEDEWNSILKNNITEYGPTYFSGASNTGAHAFVLDGFTTTDYFHINYGWGGNNNGWYWLPRSDYFQSQDAVLFLEPDKDGTSTYQDYLVFIATQFSNKYSYGLTTEVTRYEKNNSFKIWVGGVSNNGLINFTGDLKLVVCDKDYNIKQTLKSFEYTDLQPNYYSWHTRTVTITNDIADGDRICLVYKGQNSDGWTFVRGDQEDCIEELPLRANPEEIAKGLKIKYMKDLNRVIFTSKHPVHFDVKSAKGGATLLSGDAPMMEETPIYFDDLEPGEYNVEFSSGSQPYKLTVVL